MTAVNHPHGLLLLFVEYEYFVHELMLLSGMTRWWWFFIKVLKRYDDTFYRSFKIGAMDTDTESE